MAGAIGFVAFLTQPDTKRYPSASSLSSVYSNRTLMSESPVLTPQVPTLDGLLIAITFADSRW